MHVAADYATLAIVRDEDVIFFRNRSTGGNGDLADSSTRRRCTTRIGWAAAASRASCWPARRCAAPRRPSGSAGCSRSGSGWQVEAIDFRPAAALRDRIVAAPELLDVLAPAVGVLLRDAWRGGRPGPGPHGAGGLVLRTNLSTRPFYNERAVHVLLALAALIVVVLTAFNAIRICRCRARTPSCRR